MILRRVEGAGRGIGEPAVADAARRAGEAGEITGERDAQPALTESLAEFGDDLGGGVVEAVEDPQQSGGDVLLARFAATRSEWSCDPTDDPTSRDVWAKTNPSMGVVVMKKKIDDEWETLKARPDVFRRERLGEWGRSGDHALALDEAQWAAGSVTEMPARSNLYQYSDGPTRVIGVDTTFNAEWTTLTEAVPLEDGGWGLVVLDAAPGLDWITASVAALKEPGGDVIVCFDPLRTGDLTMDLRAAGLRDTEHRRRIQSSSGRDLTLACDALLRANREGKLLHSDPRLDAAAGCATRSTFDDGRGWKLVATGGGDVSPLIGGALALRALQAIPPRKPVERRMVIL